mgnify:FL=1
MAKKIKDADGNVYVQKPPFYKKWWFILIVILIGYSAIKGGGSSTESLQTTSSSEKSEVVKASSSAAETGSSKIASEEKRELSNKIGDVVKVGDVEYTVNSKEITQNVGGEYGKTANGTFLVLNVTVKNNGSKSITVTDNFFTLLKNKTEYQADGAAGLYANEDAKFFLTELNPENSITGNVVFDLSSETANDPNLQLQVQTGYWGTQKGVINLN